MLTPISQYMKMPCTLKEIVLNNAESAPTSPAIISRSLTITYADLGRLNAKTEAYFKSIGLRPHHRVGIVANKRYFAASLLLTIGANAIAVPINPNQKKIEFERFIAPLKLDAIIFEETVPEYFLGISDQLQICNISVNKNYDFHLLSNRPIESEPKKRIEITDAALILTTSGTTSQPKIVVLTHQNLMYSATMTASALGLRHDDVALSVMPLHHVGGIVPGFLSAMASKGSVYFPDEFNAANFKEWILDGSPTWMTAVPSMYDTILKCLKSSEKKLNHRFRFFRAGASGMNSKLFSEIDDYFGVPFFQAYGMTESAGLICSGTISSEVLSVGKPIGTEVKLDNGEILIRGQGVFAGYEAENGLEQSSFKDGWFRTGDIGHFEDPGLLFIDGRLKELIKRAGETISPLEIENVLNRNPKVSNVIVFGLPDPVLGEEIYAAVVLKDGINTVAADIIFSAAKEISDYKLPKKIFFVDKIPTTATGKVIRRDVARKFENSLKQKGQVMQPATKEEQILKIFSEAMGQDIPDSNIEFFTLGDSILGANIVTKINQAFDLELSLIHLYLTPVISEFIKVIMDTKTNQPSSLQTNQRSEIKETLSHYKILMSPPLPPQISNSFDIPEGCELIMARQGTPEFYQAAESADILVIAPREPLGQEFFSKAKKLRLVQCLTAGYDNIDLAAAKSAEVPVANNGSANAIPVAEHTLLLILSAYKNMVHEHNNVIQGKWRTGGMLEQQNLILKNKKIGLIGFGKIAQNVARYCKAFGINVHYYDIEASRSDLSVLGKYEDFESLLRTSDIISLHIPGGKENNCLIGAEQFSLMKKTCVLINTSRGNIIDENALFEALKNRKIAFAALDVLTQEPPPRDHKLFTLPNVIITPHIAAASIECWPEIFAVTTRNINLVLAGQVPEWSISA